MQKLLIALFVVVVVVATVSIADRLRERSYSEIVADQARAEAIQRRYEVDARLYEEWAPRITWGLALCVVLVVTYLAGLGAAHVRAKWTLTRPDRHGLLPVQHGDNDAAVAALIAYHQSRIAAASRQPVPEHLHYAPHVHYRTPSFSPAATPPGDVAQTVTIPAFADLLAEGKIGRSQPLLLGCDLTTGEGVWGTWRDLYSAGLGGVQGSGKTWTAASLIAQSLLAGARIVLCDPHAGDAESLTTRLEPLAGSVELIVDDPAHILQAAHYAHEELERRKALAREKQRYDSRQLILVLDEWTALLRGKLHDALPPLIQAITTEGRKYGVQALLLAQRWSAAASGGSDVRNTLTAHYVHRMRADEARMMTGLRGSVLPKDTLALRPGEAYLLDTRGTIRKVATPSMEQRDLVRVAWLLSQPAPVCPPGSRAVAGDATLGREQRAVAGDANLGREQRDVAGDANLGREQRLPRRQAGDGTGEAVHEGAREAAHEGASTAPLRPHQNAVKWTAEELRILTALRSGKTPGEVASELAGVRGGQKYQAAARHVADVIRRALEHIE